MGKKGAWQMTDTHKTDLVALTVDIVAAYVRYNAVFSDDLPELIVTIHSALADNEHPQVEPEIKLVPAVDPRRSVFPDFIVSLESGQKFKLLRSHLRLLGMTPEQYRAKWGLPSTYPMVAPNYATQRSTLAKLRKFGHKTSRRK